RSSSRNGFRTPSEGSRRCRFSWLMAHQGLDDECGIDPHLSTAPTRTHQVLFKSSRTIHAGVPIIAAASVSPLLSDTARTDRHRPPGGELGIPAAVCYHSHNAMRWSASLPRRVPPSISPALLARQARRISMTRQRMLTLAANL